MLRFDQVRFAVSEFRLEVDFAVGAAARVALLGPSGAGKSTVLNLIAGFATPSAGDILIDGKSMCGVEPGKRPVSVLFQDGNLFPHLSAFQNVALGIRPNLRLSGDEKAQVVEALAKVGLEGMGARKPAELSGGQQSRVALARVLVQQRPILLLDEPFAALGPALKNEMLDLVAEITEARAQTVMMVSHDPEDALRLCPETILVAEGQTEKPADTKALLSNPPKALAKYLGRD